MIDHVSKRLKFGIVGGLGAIGAADLLMKIIKTTPAGGDHEQLDITFEQQPFDDGGAVADDLYNPNHRKFYVYNTLKDMERRGCKAALLPCFISHSFIDEILPEIDMDVLNLFDALRDMLARDYSAVTKVGVITSSFMRKSGMFDRMLPAPLTVLYPSDDIQVGAVMPAIYGSEGIKAGRLTGNSVDWLVKACTNLAEQGAQVIVLGSTELPILLDNLRLQVATPIIDVNQAYAELVLAYRGEELRGTFKIGVVGGVGPAATVDFLDKVVKRTPAIHDQDHLKVVVEQNPQIPDRTANLVASGDDPTIPLYSTCRRLEAAGANVIAIPCNTAHAYVDRIQKHLAIPIVNMLTETVDYIRLTRPEVRIIGLLATDGTVKSGVYQEALEAAGLSLVVPREAVQAQVMDAIYGDTGVKAGYTQGKCRERLNSAIAHLREIGAEIGILGCTELPIIAPETETCGDLPFLLDPTDILARKCVSLAQDAAKSRRV